VRAERYGNGGRCPGRRGDRPGRWIRRRGRPIEEGRDHVSVVIALLLVHAGRSGPGWDRFRPAVSRPCAATADDHHRVHRGPTACRDFFFFFFRPAVEDRQIGWVRLPAGSWNLDRGVDPLIS